MAYQLKYENDSRGLVIEMSGTISGDEVIKINEELWEREYDDQLYYAIWDFSNVEKLNISSQQMRRVADLDKQASVKHPNHTVAMVGKLSVLKALDAVYNAYAKVWIGFESKTFNEIDNARQWLEKIHPQLFP